MGQGGTSWQEGHMAQAKKHRERELSTVPELLEWAHSQWPIDRLQPTTPTTPPNTNPLGAASGN